MHGEDLYECSLLERSSCSPGDGRRRPADRLRCGEDCFRGILLGRFNGALLAIGTVLSTGNTDKDGRPFNYADDSYTAVLLLSGQYLDAVNGMAGKGEMPADNALTTASE